MKKTASRKATPTRAARPKKEATSPPEPAASEVRTEAIPVSEPSPAREAVGERSYLVPYDENLLELVRTHWQFGDWESLAQLKRDTLQHHPDRAKLALLAAAGHMQQGDMLAARQFTQIALDWGCNKQLICRILISGVHNSLGRTAAIAGRKDKALNHFEKAVDIGTPGNDVRLLTQARINEQLIQLDAPPLVLRSLLDVSATQHRTFRGTAKSLSNLKLRAHFHGILADLHHALTPKFYLEIGVGRGQSLALARCRAIGVDPVPQERIPLRELTQLVTATSDDFFAFMVKEHLAHPPDLVLLDGMPLVDYTLRDFKALEPWTSPQTLVLVPGIYPPTGEQATRCRKGIDWYGDIWKFSGILQRFRPDLRLLSLDVEPAGLLLITGLNPSNKILEEKLKEIAPAIAQDDPPSKEILQRFGAAPVGGEQYMSFLQGITPLIPDNDEASHVERKCGFTPTIEKNFYAI